MFNEAPFIIYSDLKCLIEKTDWCKNNLERSSPSCFPMSTILSFKIIENKHDIHRCKDCNLLNL